MKKLIVAMAFLGSTMAHAGQMKAYYGTNQYKENCVILEKIQGDRIVAVGVDNESRRDRMELHPVEYSTNDTHFVYWGPDSDRVRFSVSHYPSHRMISAMYKSRPGQRNFKNCRVGL
ncbi:hypothetical protein GW916_10175 [bacterium]|nr:hypothetical protein [bacterium]